MSSKETKHASFNEATNDFAFNLMSVCGNEKNTFISPFSISTALSMLYLGSDGTTSERLRKVLNYDKYDLSEADIQHNIQAFLSRVTRAVEGYELSMFNGVMIQKDRAIFKSYEQKLEHYYSAKLETVDFEHEGEEARVKINEAVKKATKGKIANFLTENLDKYTKMFLLNAVYFLGHWKDQFDADKTYEGCFYNNGNEMKTVQMMRRKGDYQYGWIESLEASLIVLPYAGNRSASMIIVLPDSRTEVEKLQRSISRDVLDRSVSSLHKQNINLHVPKFSLEYSVNLEKSLVCLGLEELFSDKANLSRMAQAELQVTSAAHKAVIEVNEKGCEAAAATGFACGITCLQPEITVEHPFLFFIREDSSGIVLFSGRVDEL